MGLPICLVIAGLQTNDYIFVGEDTNEELKSALYVLENMLANVTD